MNAPAADISYAVQKAVSCSKTWVLRQCCCNLQDFLDMCAIYNNALAVRGGPCALSRDESASNNGYHIPSGPAFAETALSVLVIPSGPELAASCVM